MAEGPIPWTAVNEYLSHMRIIEFDERDRFFKLVHAMDSAYLEYREKTRPKK